MDQALKFIGYDHPPEKMAELASVHKLAIEMDRILPDCEQKRLGMQKLLEAKDCFMRAKLTKELAPQGIERSFSAAPVPNK
jgi:hypothetical protein